jgi:hypothetical protein
MHLFARIGHAVLDDLLVYFQVHELFRSVKPARLVLAAKPELELHDSRHVSCVLQTQDTHISEIWDYRVAPCPQHEIIERHWLVRGGFCAFEVIRDEVV